MKACSRIDYSRFERLEPRILLAVYVVDVLIDALSDDTTTLRAALCAAAQTPEDDTIRFDPRVFADDTTIRLTEGELVVASNVVVEGPTGARLTLEATPGSRVFSVESVVSASFRNLTLTGGDVDRDGGLVFSAGVETSFANVVLKSGSARNGGGIAVSSGALALNDSTVESCTSSRGGGAIWLASGTTLNVVDSTISGNSAGWYGGGIYAQSASVSVQSSVVSENVATYDGGGFAQYAGALRVERSVIRENRAICGGGILNYGDCALYGSLVIDNAASSSENTPGRQPVGGGIAQYSGSLVVTGSTVAGNVARGVGAAGGGLYVVGQSARLTNSIVATNEAPDGSDVYANTALEGHNVLSTWTNWNASSSATLLYDASKPLFVDASTGDYRLCDGSQGIDAGDDALALADGFGIDSRDLAGNSRYCGACVDLGAFESEPTVDESLIVGFANESYVVEEGNALFLAVSAETSPATVYRWDFGTGVFVEGSAESRVDVVKLGLAPGEYTLRLQTQTEDGRLSRIASASLTVKPATPSISVRRESTDGGQVARLCLNVYSPRPIAKWTIDWGDGTSSTFDSTSFSLIAAKRYASKSVAADYSITLKLVDVAGYGVKTTFSLGVQRVEASVVSASAPYFVAPKKSALNRSLLDAYFASYADSARDFEDEILVEF